MEIVMDITNVSRQSIIGKTEKLLDVCLSKADQANPGELAALLSPLTSLLEMVGGDWAGLSNAERMEQFSMQMNYQLPQSKLKELKAPEYEVSDADHKEIPETQEEG
jgi:hypothetical protein